MEGGGKLQLDRRELEVLFTHVDAAVIAYTSDGRMSFTSPSITELTGWMPDELEGQSVFDYLHPEDVARLADNMTRWIGRDGITRDANVRVRTPSGDWVELAMESVNGDSVEAFGAGIATLHRISESTHIEQELRQRLVNEDRLTRLARTFVDTDRHAFDDGVRQALAEMGSLEGVDRIAVWQVDGNRVLRQTHEWVPPSVDPILGKLAPIAPDSIHFARQLAQLEEVRIRDVEELPDDRDVERRAFRDLGVRCWLAVPMAEAGRFAGFIAFSSGRPNEILDHTHLTTLRAAAGILAAAFARHRAEERIHYQATHDELTGLANRWAFMDELRSALDDVRAGDSGGVAVLLFDLDRFKVVNDSLGHSVGDELLVAVAERMRSAIRSGELLARLGGDELVVMLPSVESPNGARDRATELLANLSEHFTIGVNEILTTASCGVAHVAGRAAGAGGAGGAGGGEMTSAGDLLRSADTAMYAAKERGRRRVAVFDEALRERVERRHGYERELPRALASGNLELHYQPEFDLASRRIVGMEALLRWHHGAEGLLTASSFVPVAEESGAIVEIGRWVLAAALGQVAEWQADAGIEPFVMRINLSSRQLAEPDFVAMVTEALAQSGAEPASVCFELTETELMADADLTLRVLRDLHKLGVTLAVDDFGTGYSSLAYLHTFPIDVVKIDQTFVQALETRPDGGTTMVRAILSLAEAIGLDVTAEGVETDAQLDELVRLGCPRAQGFLLARPASAAEVASLLRTS